MAKTFSLIALIFLSLLTLSHSTILSTKGRWIVDARTGQRVKLRCVNLVAHAQTMVAQGVDKRPLKELASEITRRNFTCVRLTYSTHIFTRYSFVKIGDALDALDVEWSKSNVKAHNPAILDMTVVEAYAAVIEALGSAGLMVELDNHISQPRWCCSNDDGNAFFGDRNFDPTEWLKGLAIVAKRFSFMPAVVAMSLRNELRGSLSNVDVWHKYVAMGTHLIHGINPKLLVVVSGLNFDNDLSFLNQKPLPYSLNNKLVLEAHLYSFSGAPQSKFVDQPLNSACDQIMQKLEREAGFVVNGKRPFPLYISEFGFDQSGNNQADNRFMSCFVARLAEKDLDWALWAFQGSYIYRQGREAPDESFGIMDYSWTKDRYPKLAQMLELIKRINQDPNSKAPMAYIMYHAESGKCVHSAGNGIELGDCKSPSQWSHAGDGSPVKLVSNGQCLKVAGDGQAPVFSDDCSGEQSNWTAASRSKLHLAAKMGGDDICLQKQSDSAIVTKKCICIGDDNNCRDDPQSQWFKLIPTNVA